MFKTLKDKYWQSRPMVSYWKKADSVEAKVYKSKEGHMEMKMQGEKYPFSGFPRGVLLFGGLSPLKHQIKNKIFNATWAMLEDGKCEEEIKLYLAQAWEEIYTLAEESKYDMVPFEKLVPPVKELHRSLTAIGCDTRLRDIICFIFQEDDAYRMRFQWITKFFPVIRKPTPAKFLASLAMLEHAEVVSDMKERERLFYRVFKLMVQDTEKFAAFCKETNWNKIGLTKADKYFLRAKYFKCDFPSYEY